MKKEMQLAEMLVECNEVLRSACSIAEREGKETNWVAFKKRVSGVLEIQHKTICGLRRALRKKQERKNEA